MQHTQASISAVMFMSPQTMCMPETTSLVAHFLTCQALGCGSARKLALKVATGRSTGKLANELTFRTFSCLSASCHGIGGRNTAGAMPCPTRSKYSTLLLVFKVGVPCLNNESASSSQARLLSMCTERFGRTLFGILPSSLSRKTRGKISTGIWLPWLSDANLLGMQTTSLGCARSIACLAPLPDEEILRCSGTSQMQAS